jgi:hypothetical protein
MRRADRGEARMVPKAAADSNRSWLCRVRGKPGSLAVPETLGTSGTLDGKERTAGFVRPSDAVWSVVVSRGRAMSFMCASLPGRWLVVVHPSAASRVLQWEQTALGSMRRATYPISLRERRHGWGALTAPKAYPAPYS